MSNGAKGEGFVCVCSHVYKQAKHTCVRPPPVCLWVVGQLTHTEGELYPQNVLHRKHVYSSCLCVAAWFETESITSFPGRKGRVAQGERRDGKGGRTSRKREKSRG